MRERLGWPADHAQNGTGFPEFCAPELAAYFCEAKREETKVGDKNAGLPEAIRDRVTAAVSITGNAVARSLVIKPSG